MNFKPLRAARDSDSSRSLVRRTMMIEVMAQILSTCIIRSPQDRKTLDCMSTSDARRLFARVRELCQREDSPLASTSQTERNDR